MTRPDRRSDRKYEILAVLSRWPTATRREIADTIGVSHQYVSMLIEELVAAGELDRVPRKARSTRPVNMKAVSWPM